MLPRAKLYLGKPMNPPPAEIGAARRGHRHAGARRRSRCASIVTSRRWPSLRARPACACGRTPRPTSRRPLRCGRSRTARSGNACRRSARPRRWCAAASRTFWSAIRSSAMRKLRRLAALAQDATIALCFDSAEQVDAASRVAQDFGVEFGALVEIEVGMERCGVMPGKDAAALARRIAERAGPEVSRACRPITAARSICRRISSARRRSRPRSTPCARR